MVSACPRYVGVLQYVFLYQHHHTIGLKQESLSSFAKFFFNLQYILSHFLLGKGAEKKIRISYGLFTDKKIYTHFFLEIESIIAKTNFTLGPIEKFIFFVKL